MTVATELAKSHFKVEYILCIEGVGWPADETDLSSGFNGRVFCTTDLDGTMASDLGGSPTVSLGLALPSTISDSFNIRTYQYERAGANFSIVDHDEYFLNNVTPAKTSGVTDQLNSNLTYDGTTVSIDNATNTFATSDLVWVSDSELVKLGTKTLDSGTVYDYTTSTRGYLGTLRGNQSGHAFNRSAFTWGGSTTAGEGTVIRDYRRYWFNARVHLYMKVPGESGTNAVLVYIGRMRNIRTPDLGVTYKLSTVAGMVRMRKFRESTGELFVASHRWVDHEGLEATFQGEYVGNETANVSQTRNRIPEGNLADVRREILAVNDSSNPYSKYIIPFTYAYRNHVTGGTVGAYNAYNSDRTQPQAFQGGIGNYLNFTMFRIGADYLRCLHKAGDQDPANSDAGAEVMIIQGANYDLGSANPDMFSPNTPMRPMIDNILRDPYKSRFTINNRVHRHPIDVLLMFLTTMHNEYYIGDAASGGSATTINFTSPGWTTNEWAGYALHCVEGNNLGRSAKILSNTTSQITIETQPTAPTDLTWNATHTGSEYQIRNTTHDVLPLSWGMGVHNAFIDLDSFFDVKKKYLDDIDELGVGTFAIGDVDNINMWDFLVQNICVPYGILMYTDRTNGKIACRYVGNVGLQDGLDESYTTIDTDDLLEIGEIDYMPRLPAKEIQLRTRNVRTVSIKPIVEEPYWTGNIKEVTGYEETNLSDVSAASEGASHTITAPQLENAYAGEELETLIIHAMTHDTVSSAGLILRMIERLAKKESAPYPEVTVKVDISFLPTLQAGALVSITDATLFEPPNPYTGNRGWTSLVARVLSTTLETNASDPGLRLRLALLPSITGGRISPAAKVTGKGSDGNGDYFTVHTPGQSDFGIDPDDIDWNFGVDDRILLRDKNGVFKENEVVAGFGSNFVSRPEDANDGRVYVDGTIASSIATGDYITFRPWSTSNTTNMDLYAAYADGNETLGSGNDPAREYG